MINNNSCSTTSVLMFKPLREREAGRYTDKKENLIFLIYKDIQSGAVPKLYMRKGLLICEEMPKYFPIYEETVSHIYICKGSILNFLLCI
jgi:hypothetical protein